MKNFKEIEDAMKNDIETIFNKILKNKNYTLPISSNSRSGAEISDYLENEIVEYSKKYSLDNIKNITGSPKGKTKNPYDFCFDYISNKYSFKDLIWADIKAINKNYLDSNPDLGTPNKIKKFIMDGHFYMLFVLFLYEPKGNSTSFLPFKNGSYVHCMFLKDISSTVRINPKPQFQVNIDAQEEYRTKEEFLDLFKIKYLESLDRIEKNIQKKREKMDEDFAKMYEKIKKYDSQ